MLFSYKGKDRYKKIFKSIESKLSSIDEEVASEYLLWLDKKTSYLKKTFDKDSYGTQPDNLKRGDIIWVEFGINVGTELSDYKTKGHYAIVWNVDLGNVVVIPISSRENPSSSLNFDLGIIEGLNDKEDKMHSFLKLDAIRSISKRRIGRINNKEYGKISLEKEKINLIKNAIIKSFIEWKYENKAINRTSF